MPKILIADDEPSLRLLVRATLSANKSFDLIEASDGTEALSKAQSEMPDLLLLDVMMPGLSGFEVCERLKNDPNTKKIIIIMLTAKGQESDRDWAISVGTDYFLTKPFSPIELFNLIEKILSKTKVEDWGLRIKDLEITSKQNFVYKELKKLTRNNSDYVLIEGEKLLQEAINSSLSIKKIFIDKKNHNKFSKLLPKCDSELVFVKNELLASIYTTDSYPTKDDLLIALAKKPNWQIKDLFKTKKHLVFLERIQDPGNLGTIIRSALAFSAGGIILSENSADPFNTKVIRASAGAVFNMPIVFIENLKAFISQAKQNNYKIIGTSSKVSKKLNDLNFNLPSVFLFGNEGVGLSKELLNSSDEIIKIPISSKVESLNLGVSVSLVLWEASYQ